MNARQFLQRWLEPVNEGEADWRQEHAKAKVTILEQGIKDALRFLRKKHLRSFFYRHKLPWYLVLGNENAGKSSLLKKSGLGLLSIDSQPPQQINPTAYCDWWFGKNAVFHDISGSLMLPETPKNDAYYIWRKFIALLHRYRHTRPIDGLLLCVDLHDFFSKNRNQRQLQIDVFRHRIQSLTKYLSSLPVYLIFTKCDRIAGFVDTFNALSPEDCEQAFGVALPFGLVQQNVPHHLEEQFNAFLFRLNTQLIPRLHREHNIEKRARIKNFPLQLEAQKRDIIHLATQLHSTHTSLGGIYFTSSTQDGQVRDGLLPLLDNFGLKKLPEPDYAPQDKGFFIHQLLQRIIHEKLNVKKKMPRYFRWSNERFYSTFGGLLLLATLLMIPSYYHNKNALTHVRTTLTSYPDTGDTNPAAFSSLNILRQALDQAGRHNNPLFNLAFHQSSDIHHHLDETYQEALNVQLVPQLKQILETQLQAANNVRPQDYFDALKVYLMLSHPTHLNTNFVERWFQHYWRQSLTTNTRLQAQLNQHLAYWLTQKTLHFSEDASITQLARQRLNSLSLAELTYLALLEKSSVHSKSGTKLDELYQARHFNSVYYHQIPELAQQMATGDNWVLNLQFPANLMQKVTAELVENVRHLYLQRYATYWGERVLALPVSDLSSLKKIHKTAATLTTTDSPLVPLFATITAELQPIAHFPEAQVTLTLLQQLQHQVFNSSANSNLVKSLNDLTTYLDKILTANDRGDAALQAAQHRMRNSTDANDPISQLVNLAKTTPAPLNGWLNALAINSWQTILQNARNQLNVLWITEVLPDYDAHINNRFPVFNNSGADIAMADFSRFFGPDGTLDRFSKHHLAAFIDSSQLYWRFKSVDGQNLNIPQSTLEMLDRGNIIRKMYFADNQKTPSVSFLIMPTNMDLMSQNYVLNVDGQLVNYLQDLRHAKKMSWTGITNGYANLSLQSTDAEQPPTVLLQETGPWALFKLLNRSHLTPHQNTQLFDFSFTAQGVTIPYELFAEKPLNPFISGLVSAFRAPDKL